MMKQVRRVLWFFLVIGMLMSSAGPILVHALSYHGTVVLLKDVPVGEMPDSPPPMTRMNFRGSLIFYFSAYIAVWVTYVGAVLSLLSMSGLMLIMSKRLGRLERQLERADAAQQAGGTIRR